MTRSPWFSVGLVVGALIAIAAVWLFAPETGRDLMARLRRNLALARDEARLAGKQAETEILTRYEHVRIVATAPVGANRTGVSALR